MQNIDTNEMCKNGKWPKYLNGGGKTLHECFNFTIFNSRLCLLLCKYLGSLSFMSFHIQFTFTFNSRLCLWFVNIQGSGPCPDSGYAGARGGGVCFCVCGDVGVGVDDVAGDLV